MAVVQGKSGSRADAIGRLPHAMRATGCIAPNGMEYKTLTASLPLLLLVPAKRKAHRRQQLVGEFGLALRGEAVE
jgi:hypothetical protein